MFQDVLSWLKDWLPRLAVGRHPWIPGPQNKGSVSLLGTASRFHRHQEITNWLEYVIPLRHKNLEPVAVVQRKQQRSAATEIVIVIGMEGWWFMIKSFLKRWWFIMTSFTKCSMEHHFHYRALWDKRFSMDLLVICTWVTRPGRTTARSTKWRGPKSLHLCSSPGPGDPWTSSIWLVWSQNVRRCTEVMDTGCTCLFGKVMFCAKDINNIKRENQSVLQLNISASSTGTHLWSTMSATPSRTASASKPSQLLPTPFAFWQQKLPIHNICFLAKYLPINNVCFFFVQVEPKELLLPW